jgi:hypothetical protein
MAPEAAGAAFVRGPVRDGSVGDGVTRPPRWTGTWSARQLAFGCGRRPVVAVGPTPPADGVGAGRDPRSPGRRVARPAPRGAGVQGEASGRAAERSALEPTVKRRVARVSSARRPSTGRDPEAGFQRAPGIQNHAPRAERCQRP